MSASDECSAWTRALPVMLAIGVLCLYAFQVRVLEQVAFDLEHLHPNKRDTFCLPLRPDDPLVASVLARPNGVALVGGRLVHCDPETKRCCRVTYGDAAKSSEKLTDEK